MIAPGSKVDLYLNDQHVGSIHVHSFHGGWGFGEFSPLDAFAPFAPIFGRWSLFLHDAGPGHHVSRDESEVLREVEQAMDAIHAQLRIPQTDQVFRAAQVNIDGRMIEWKEY